VYFVNRYFYPDESATAQMLSDLCFGLATLNFEVHVVCSRQLYETPAARLASQETARGVFVHRVWTSKFGRENLFGRAADYASFYLTCATQLLRAMKRGDIVVAKTDPPLISIVVAVVARIKRAILVNWLQDVFPEVASQLAGRRLPAALDLALRRLRDRSLRSAARNVVLGSRMEEYLQVRGVPRNNIQIIENWADCDSVAPKQAAQSMLRSKLGLQEKFVVAYSGNLGRAHEYETLAGAAELLCSDARIAFLLIGGGSNMEALKEWVARRRLANFHFLPYQPRASLEDSLAAADVHLAILVPQLEGFVVPSKFYGILASGRPVVFIGDPDGELARVIRASRCGRVVATGGSADLAAIIEDLRCDEDGRKSMGQSARELLCSRFSASRALASWTELLSGLRQADADGISHR
jgi:glycosyltransferase involved in cell wall biosynthesis